MILADKIIQLRKKNAWSQEEFAMHMNVSRQAVSKWEQAQSIPDLDKILLMAKIFGVSTDYLLKDELEIEEHVESNEAEYPLRRVSMEEAHEFLMIKEKSRFMIAIATFLCIISPAFLIWIGGAAEYGFLNIHENTAGTLGLVVLVILIAIAVTIFMFSASKTRKFEFLEEENFELEYGVSSMLKQRQEEFHPSYTKYNIMGVLLCILSPIPLFISGINENDFLQVTAVALLLLIVALGVYCFIIVGVKWSALQQLLQEGDYSRKKKQQSSITGTIAGSYWLIVTAIYLFISFTQNNWNQSWIIWPVAGVLFAALMIIVSSFVERNDK